MESALPIEAGAVRLVVLNSLKFLNFFEQDYILWQSECKEILEASDEQLTKE